MQHYIHQVLRLPRQLHERFYSITKPIVTNQKCMRREAEVALLLASEYLKDIIPKYKQ
jgi:hypothetical protein